MQGAKGIKPVAEDRQVKPVFSSAEFAQLPFIRLEGNASKRSGVDTDTDHCATESGKAYREAALFHPQTILVGHIAGLKRQSLLRPIARA